MTGSPDERRVAADRAGWLIHLLLLAAYPVFIGLAGWRQARLAAGPALPPAPGPMLGALTVELLLFAVVLGAALVASRASASQLLLRWPGWRSAAWHGLLWSVALRFGLALLVLGSAALGQLFGIGTSEITDALQPDTGQLIDVGALAADPLYLVLNLTLVSFVVAGLREEIWRAAMLAALAALLPRAWASRVGRLAAVLFVAVLFGFGHLAQGPGAVVLTAVLGAGLGAIMLHARSVWPAVFAHGFFNATSFLLLRAVLPG